MKVSIAVPSLDYGRFIRSCLQSLLGQSHSDIEVLVCDAGSTDDSLKVIDQFVAADDRVKLVSTSDSGQADAVDKAFRVASGDILCYLNADDLLLDNEALSNVVELFRTKPEVDVACFGSVYVDENGSVLRRVRLRVNPFDGLPWIRYRGQVVQPSAFWRRAVYEAIPFNVAWHYCFDTRFFYEASKRFAFYESPVLVAGYRLHGSNKSVGISWKRIEELAKFEGYKFGNNSIRERYLHNISRLIFRLEGPTIWSRIAQRLVYCIVNSLSFATWYRVPGI